MLTIIFNGVIVKPVGLAVTDIVSDSIDGEKPRSLQDDRGRKIISIFISTQV